MVTPPCIDCIVLGMCKSKVETIIINLVELYVDAPIIIKRVFVSLYFSCSLIQDNYSNFKRTQDIEDFLNLRELITTKQLEHRYGSIDMGNQIPCIDCLTLGMCKSRILNLVFPLENLREYCSLIRNYFDELSDKSTINEKERLIEYIIFDMKKIFNIDLKIGQCGKSGRIKYYY